jgi:hypothetical protein
MPSISYEFVASGHDAVRRAYLSIAEAEEKAAAASARASARVTESLKGLGRTRGPTAAGLGPVAGSGAGSAASVRAQVTQETRERTRAIREEERARIQSARRVAQEEASRKREMARIDREMESRYERGQRERQRAAEREAEFRQASADAQRRERSSTSGGAMKEFFGSMLAMWAYDKLKGTVESAARESIALQESTNRLSINARGAGEEFVDPTVLRKEFEQAAVATPGQKAQDIADAIQSFVSLTGELKTGRESAQSFATVASATGSSVGDVSQAAASIYNQFGLKTKAEMQDVLASLTFQGKKGAFELRDAASQFQRLAAAGASFGLSGAKGVKTIGGLAQIARQGTGSAEQTTTAIENIFSGLIAKSKILKGQGVNVYDKKGRTREVTDVLIEAIAKLGKGNFEKKNALMLQVFGEGPGARGMKPLLSKYQVAYQEAQKNGATQTEAMAAGMKKLREVLDDSINAPGAWAEVQRDAARAQKDISAQTSVAWERVKQATADKLLPALEKAAPKLMKLFLGENGELGPAMMAVSGFADGIGLAADAVGEFVDSLYATGILKRKPKTYAEQLDEEKKKLAKFDDETGDIYKPEFADQNAAANLDPNKVAERANMVAAITNLEDKVWTPSGEKTVDLTHDEFVKRYTELGQQTGGDVTDWAGNTAYQRRVGQIASSLEANPQYDFDALGNTMIGGDATDAQKRLVEDYRAQQFLGGGEAGKISSDMAILASSAQTAAKALQLIGASQQASITGVSGPSAGGPG